jgi:hypothetical protein
MPKDLVRASYTSDEEGVGGFVVPDALNQANRTVD